MAGDGLGDAEDDGAAAQRDSEPPAAAHEAAHTLPELELGDLPAQGVVPDDDLVRRVQGAPASAEEEEDVRRVQGDDGGEGAARELWSRWSATPRTAGRRAQHLVSLLA